MSWQKQMNNAVSYLEEHLFEDINYTALQKIVGQSAERFARTFSTVTGMTLCEYIRSRRMAVAANEILQTNSRILDIALNCGYSSAEAFSRAFSKTYGCSPTAARDKKPQLDLFMPLNFNLTVKNENSSSKQACDSIEAEEIKVFYMPLHRLIGKSYTAADLDEDFSLMSKWNECFQTDLFGTLGRLGPLEGFEDTIIFAEQSGDKVSYWMGMLFSSNTAVPAGLSYADLPCGSLGVCYLRGLKSDRQLYSAKAQRLSCETLKSFGYASLYENSTSLQGLWRFEYYENKYNLADDTGRVALGHCFYLDGRHKFAQGDAITITLTKTQSAALSPVPKSIKLIQTQPFSAKEYVQDDLMLCALSVITSKINNINSSAKYYCRTKNKACNSCCKCEMFKGELSNRHQIYSYQFLNGCAGSAFLWQDKGIFNDNVQPLLPDRLSFALKAMGISFKLLDKSSENAIIIAELNGALKKDLPVMIKFSGNNDWAVVTGISKNGLTLYGIDSYNHANKTKASAKRQRFANGIFSCDNFLCDIQLLVIPIKKETEATLAEIISRCAESCQLAEKQGIENKIFKCLKSITKENSRAYADCFNEIVAYTAQSRWDASNFFGSILPIKTDNAALRTQLCSIAADFEEMTSVCWKIWGQLGVGPHTNYGLPAIIVSMLCEKERITELKVLFNRLFSLQHSAKNKIDEISSELRTL